MSNNAKQTEAAEVIKIRITKFLSLLLVTYLGIIYKIKPIIIR